MLIRAYLRASTKQQDASRAKAELTAFAKEHGDKVLLITSALSIELILIKPYN